VPAVPGGVNRPGITAPVGGVQPRALPQGGLIGGPPGAGLVQPSATGQMRRVNPVGGVIGNEARGPSAGRQGRFAGSRVNPLTPEASERFASGQVGSQPGLSSAGAPRTAPRAGGGRARAAFSASDLPPGVTQVKRADGSIITPHQYGPTRRNDEEEGGRWDPDNPWKTGDGVAPVLRPSEHHDRVDPGPAIGLDR
jgi:hypothetical protein